MSDIGAISDISNVTFTFDDEAAATLGDGTDHRGPRYQPQNQGGDCEDFPAPAPALTGNSALSVFDGTAAERGLEPLHRGRPVRRRPHDLGLATCGSPSRPTPYPSTVNVSGLPHVTDVNVKLQGLASSTL